MTQTNLLTKQKQTLRLADSQTQKTSFIAVSRGKGGEGEIKSLGWTDTPTYKIGNQQGIYSLAQGIRIHNLYEFGASVTVVLDREF